MLRAYPNPTTTASRQFVELVASAALGPSLGGRRRLYFALHQSLPQSTAADLLIRDQSGTSSIPDHRIYRPARIVDVDQGVYRSPHEPDDDDRVR